MTTPRPPRHAASTVAFAAAVLLAACSGAPAPTPALDFPQTTASPQTTKDASASQDMESVAQAIRNALEVGPVRAQGFDAQRTGSSLALVDDTAHFIAITANALAAFNADPSVVLDENVDLAATEEGLDPSEGWVVDVSSGTGATISLTQGGGTCTASIEIVSGSARSTPPTGTCNQGSLVSTPTFTLDVDAAGNVLFADLRENVNTNEYRIVDGSLFSMVATYRKDAPGERVWVLVDAEPMYTPESVSPLFPLSLASLQGEIFASEIADGAIELKACLAGAKIVQIASVEPANASFSLSCPAQPSASSESPLVVRVDLDADGNLLMLTDESTDYRVAYDRSAPIAPVVSPSPVREGSAASELIMTGTFALETKSFTTAVFRDAFALAASDGQTTPTAAHVAAALVESGCGSNCLYDPRTKTFTRRSDEFAVSCVAKVSFTPPAADAEDDPYKPSVAIAYCEKG